MKITILTLFPDQFDGFVNTSIIKRAIEKKLVEVEVINFRDYSDDRLKRVDEYPYGGGAGMIIKLQPILDCLKTIKTPDSVVYLLSASGDKYDQSYAHKLATFKHLILICGHYEGIDARIENYIDGKISIGDYILTGGELASMVVADSVIRLLDGSINSQSTEDESFENGLLEYPQYTSPRVYDGHEVPDILFSGNHKEIWNYRFKERIKETLRYRKDLFDKYTFTKEERKLLESLDDDSKEKTAIYKAKKFTKKKE